MDVEKAIRAFNRLLGAIESRLPQTLQYSQILARGEISIVDAEEQSSQQIRFPYTSSVLDGSFARQNSFARAFLSALPARHVNFRYIASGIQLLSPTEFINQPFASRWDTYDRILHRGEQNNPDSIPLCSEARQLTNRLGSDHGFQTESSRTYQAVFILNLLTIGKHGIWEMRLGCYCRSI